LILGLNPVPFAAPAPVPCRFRSALTLSTFIPHETSHCLACPICRKL
jgi:hypothetical protein